MKETLTLLVILLLFSISKAQTSFGIQVDGIAANQVASRADYKLNTLLTWKFGLLANMPITSNLSLMPQLNLVNKGMRATGQSNNNSGNYTVTNFTERLSYLELPVYLLYRSTRDQKNGFFIGAGPVISYGLIDVANGQRVPYINNSVSSIEPIHYNIRLDDNYDTGDGSYHAKSWDISVRYNWVPIHKRLSRKCTLYHWSYQY